MDKYTPVSESVINEQREILTDKGQLIKEHLKTVVSEDVYYRWIDHFVFEKINANRVVVGYYGTEPLKKFNKQHKVSVWINICSVVGYTKKLKICKRKNKKVKTKSLKVKKNIKVARLFVMSIIFVAITFGVAVIGFNYIGNRNFKESFYSVGNLKVNNKIRIVQISDLHSSSYGKDNSKLISRVEKLKPDLIIYTGDCLDSDDDSTKEIVALCSKLAKVAPSYYIYGNNEVERCYDIPLTQAELDKKFGFSDDSREPQKLLKHEDAFEKELEATGVKVMKNEMDTINVGSTKVDIYGVLTSNPSSFWSYAGESFDEHIYKNSSNLKITAIHEPFVFEEYSPETWGDIMLCGHNHGGTIRVPVLGPLYIYESGLFPEREGHFVYGRYEVSGSPLIVSSGLDNNNMLRINNQPELVIVDINRF